MQNRFKDLLIIFLVALLGSFIGVYGANHIYKEENKEVITIKQAGESSLLYERSDLKKAINLAYNTVVEIEVSVKTYDFFNRETRATNLGSGVIISEDGYIITNDHVISGASTIEVKTSNGEKYTAKLIGSDSKTDIAVIKIEASNLAYANLANSEKVEIGDTVIAIGNPLGTGIAITDGIISGLNKRVILNNENMELFQTNAAVNQGNSGGGLFDLEGKLIGIVNAKRGSSTLGVSVEGLAYAIPSNKVANIANDIIANGYVKNRATLGVGVTYVSDESSGFEKGLYITRVYPNSAAEKAKLEMYDRIVSFNGETIDNYNDLNALIQKCEVDEQIELGIIRQDKNMTFKVILQEAQIYD